MKTSTPNTYHQLPLGDPSKPVTLRRSCQTCIKGKRRCDQRWPKCSRCLGLGRDCEYINAPLTATFDNKRSSIRKNTQNSRFLTYPIRPSLRLEIAKQYDQPAIQFLVNGLREYPRDFAKEYKTDFLHPAIYTSRVPAIIRDTNSLCKIYVQLEQLGHTHEILRHLQLKLDEIHRRLSRSSTFDELLGLSQALIIILCILALNQDPSRPYSEGTGYMLERVAKGLWEQAPVQLPSTLTRRHAWLLAESVRRTIIVALMLRSAYSLKTREYSVRTPFVDALPFDVRTTLWDDDSSQDWDELNSASTDSMISLHEYSGAMENGSVRDIGNFGALILAACKGKQISAVQYPPRNSCIPT